MINNYPIPKSITDIHSYPTLLLDVNSDIVGKAGVGTDNKKVNWLFAGITIGAIIVYLLHNKIKKHYKT